MTEFLDWLRAEMWRLLSFDWKNGSWRIHELSDGVAKFSSDYPIQRLVKHLKISEDEFLEFIDSQRVSDELESRSFTASWRDQTFTLTWLEPGVRDWQLNVDVKYFEENGQYYMTTRTFTRVVYVDGTEKILNDSGDPKPVEISEEEFNDARSKLESEQK